MNVDLNNIHDSNSTSRNNSKNKKWKIAREPQAKQDHINKEIGNHQQVKNIYKNSSYRQMPCDQTFIMT